MSRTTIWTCDRCKVSGPGGVHSFDFGNDYSLALGLPDKQRMTVDLCLRCWTELKAWLRPND